jgi:hypothetical protein
MPSSSGYARAIASEIGDIERRLQVVQGGLEKLRARAPASAQETATSLGEALSSVLSNWSGHFRNGARALGDQSTALDKGASRYGTAALKELSAETAQRPLLIVGVALAVGFAFGMTLRGRT